MKKLNQIIINPARRIPNDDLMKFRGGGNNCFLCICPEGVPSKYEWAATYYEALQEGTKWCSGSSPYNHCSEVSDNGWCGY